jgi:hypothetical protein
MILAMRGISYILFRILLAVVLLPSLTLLAAKGYEAKFVPNKGKADRERAAAAAQQSTGLPLEPGGTQGDVDRARYDQCVAYVRESYQPERLDRCAAELVGAWDASHARKRRFANMPDGAAFASGIGQMYAAYAEATGHVDAALAGVRGLQERVRTRYPRDEAALEALREQESALAAGRRGC